MRPLVILRPEPGASETAGRARAMGLEAVVWPLFDIRPLRWSAPDPARFDAILMTSANAARFGGPELEKLRALPIHAVGEATAQAAREAEFEVASIGTGGAGQLDLPKDMMLLHLAGRHRQPVEGAESIAVYEAVELPPPEGLSALADAVVAVHSPRAGHRFSGLVEDRGRLTIAAISQAGADACGAGWQRVEIADLPRDSSLLALAARLCNTLGE